MLDALPCLRSVNVYLDGMGDDYLRAYAAWPTRMHGVHAGRVGYIVSTRHAQFHPAPMRDWLVRACAREHDGAAPLR